MSARETPADIKRAEAVATLWNLERTTLVVDIAQAIADARAEALAGVCPCAAELAAVGVHDSFACPVGIARGAL